MVKRCVVQLCGNTYKTGHTIHLFPKDQHLRRQWVKFVQIKRADFRRASDHSVICSEHFTPESYVKTYMNEFCIKQRKTLLPGAVPTIQPQPKPSDASSNSLKRRGESGQSEYEGSYTCTSHGQYDVVKRSRAADKLQVNRLLREHKATTLSRAAEPEPTSESDNKVLFVYKATQCSLRPNSRSIGTQVNSQTKDTCTQTTCTLPLQSTPLCSPVKDLAESQDDSESTGSEYTPSDFCFESDDSDDLPSNNDLKELVNVSEVCREWHRVAQDSSLWSNLNLSPYRHRLQEDTIYRIISRNFVPLGRRLSLNGCDVTSDMLKTLLRRCRFLNSLSLKDCRFHNQGGSGNYFNDVGSLRMLDLRQARGYSVDIENILERADHLECLGMHCCFPSTMSHTVFVNKPLLRVLDCTQSDWLNDDFVNVIADKCPELEYLSLARCYNYIGNSLPVLLRRCKDLKTLLLSGTRIDDSCLLQTDWCSSSITSLDLRHCSRITHIGVAEVLLLLPRLRYLKCALTDESCRILQYRGFPDVEVLQILRRYPITINIVSSLLIGCSKVTCLDVSSIPFAHDHFEAFLPGMTSLKWLSFAANECSGTDLIVRMLAKYSKKLESLWVIYYHSNEREDIKQAFVELIDECMLLRTVNLTGLYVNDLICELQQLVDSVFNERDVKFLQNERFVLPQPELNVDIVMGFS